MFDLITFLYALLVFLALGTWNAIHHYDPTSRAAPIFATATLLVAVVIAILLFPWARSHGLFDLDN